VHLFAVPPVVITAAIAALFGVTVCFLFRHANMPNPALADRKRQALQPGDHWWDWNGPA